MASPATDKRLSMEFLAESYIKIEDDVSVPVYYGSLTAPAFIQGVVLLEIDRECDGYELETTFKVSAGFKAEVQGQQHIHLVSEKVYLKKRWNKSLGQDGKVSSGQYREPVTATIDPLFPSSYHYFPGGHKVAWVRYTFDIRFLKQTKMGPTPVLEQTFEAWVLNSIATDSMPSSATPSVPMPLPTPPEKRGLWSRLTSSTNDSSCSTSPFYQQAMTKKTGLGVSVSIPATEGFEIGQVVPVTITVHPFDQSSKFYGQLPILTELVFKLKEDIHGRNETQQYAKFDLHQDLFKIALQTEDWIKKTEMAEAGIFQKVINLSLPMHPQMTASAKTPWFDVEYTLSLSVKVRAEGQKEREAEALKIQLPINVVAPRLIVDELPVYAQNE
ncbi:hypothetical protein BGZ83_007914 [Gryganskiella cystojenkinii]|nr:hypothetical protein BGZ83_007914 [Gryganskiella cystojenkinii]